MTDEPSGDGTPEAEAPDPRFTLDRKLLEALVCPVTQSPLVYDRDAQELVSRAARLAYPIREGVPIMLVSEARELG